MTKMVCTGVVTAMSVSPSGHYCAAAIQDKLHIWQVGVTLAVLAISREIRVFPRTVGNIGKYWAIWKVCSYLVI